MVSDVVYFTTHYSQSTQTMADLNTLWQVVVAKSLRRLSEIVSRQNVELSSKRPRINSGSGPFAKWMLNPCNCRRCRFLFADSVALLRIVAWARPITFFKESRARSSRWSKVADPHRDQLILAFGLTQNMCIWNELIALKNWWKTGAFWSLLSES